MTAVMVMTLAMVLVLVSVKTIKQMELTV